MFKSFTGSDSKLPARGKGAPTEPTQPATVQWAVRCMLAGAVVSTVLLIFALIATSHIKGELIAYNATLPKAKQATPGQINSAATVYILSSIITGLISTGLWLWMARMNGSGRNWARITASVLLALWTFYTYTIIGQTRASAAFITDTAIVLVIWLIGLAALYFLWRPDSTAFFKAESS